MLRSRTWESSRHTSMSDSSTVPSLLILLVCWSAGRIPSVLLLRAAGKFSKIRDLHSTIRKASHDIKLPPHRLDMAAQS